MLHPIQGTNLALTAWILSDPVKYKVKESLTGKQQFQAQNVVLQGPEQLFLLEIATPLQLPSIYCLSWHYDCLNEMVSKDTSGKTRILLI